MRRKPRAGKYKEKKKEEEEEEVKHIKLVKSNQNNLLNYQQ